MSVSYTKTPWVNGSTPPISAANLNKIEQGIEDCANEINSLSSTVDDLDAAIDNKADADSVYNKSQVDTALGNKQNVFAEVDPTDPDYIELSKQGTKPVRFIGFRALTPLSANDDDIVNREMLRQFFTEIDGYNASTPQQLLHDGTGTLRWVDIN